MASWQDLCKRPGGKISGKAAQGLYARSLRKISVGDLYTRSLGRISLTDLCKTSWQDLCKRPGGKISVRGLRSLCKVSMQDLLNLRDKSLHTVSWKDLFDRSLYKTFWPLGKISVRGPVARSLERLHKVSMQGLFAKSPWEIFTQGLLEGSL